MGPIFGLDLGTKTGFSYQPQPGRVFGGTWLLATEKQLREARKVGKDRSGDIRVIELQSLLGDQAAFHKAQSLGGTVTWAFEDVQFLSSQAQSQLWASFRTVVWIVAHEHGFRVLPVPVGTLKKFATGHGNATKEMMLAALQKTDEIFPVDADDNEVDARWLRRFAAQSAK
jgi:hypothetical protein